MVRTIRCCVRGPDWSIRPLVLAVTLCWNLPICVASTSYTPVILYPLDPPAGLKIGGIADAAGGQVVGSSEANPNNHALLWNGRPTAIDLGQGNAFATDGTQQVGWNGSSALLWAGTGASALELSLAETVAYGVGGGEQVGTDMTNALLWHGTPASLVKLSGNDSQALGADGVHQVGMMGFRDPHAMLWSGTAASAVDLHPTQFQGSVASAAVGVAGSQQVGYVMYSGIPAPWHATLWTGTATSAVDLNPHGSVFSRANGTNGFQQVGVMDLSLGIPHAVVWTGTANSAIDLQALLPARYTQSIGSSIDPAGNVFGWANDSAGNYYAVEWLPHAVVPGDANLDGKVDFSDLVTLARSYGQAGGWAQGDFDGDMSVGFDDLLILARNYGRSLSAAQLAQFDPSFRADVEAAFANVPEPSILAALPLVTGVLLLRVRRFVER